MEQNDLFIYREKYMEFADLYDYNNEYNLFNNKTNLKSTIWRYMDISKLLSIINSKTLFFSKPRYFRDPFEGAFSERDLRMILGEPPTYIPDILLDYNALRERYIRKFRLLLDFVGISCWHMNEVESAAMWELYLNSNEGLAIKTSIERLIDSLKGHDNLFIGKVQYIDYSTEMASRNIFETLFYKRKSFEHEHELRLIALENDEAHHFGQSDISLTVDLDTLIEEIYIHPTAPNWFVEAVTGLLKRYKINKPIIQSTLYSGPKMVW